MKVAQVVAERNLLLISVAACLLLFPAVLPKSGSATVATCLVSLATTLAITVFLGASCFIQVKAKIMSGDFFLLLISLFLLILVVVELKIVFGNVLFGWDVLSFWAERSLQVAEHKTLSEFHAMERHRHPAVIPWVISTSSSALSALPGVELHRVHGLVFQILWLAIVYLMWMTIYWFGVRAGADASVAFIFATMATTVPLIENHSLITGYTELWVSLVCMTSCCMLTIAIENKRALLVIIPMLLLLACAGFKNVGIFYSGIVLFALIVVTLPKAWILICLLASSFVLLGASETGFSIWLWGSKVAWYPDKNWLFFGGVKLVLRPTDFREIAQILTHALATNASFSVVALCGLICVFGAPPIATHRLITISFAATFSGIVASLWTQYGYLHSTPWQDTGFTRHLIPSYCMLAVLIAGCLGGISFESRFRYPWPEDESILRRRRDEV